MTEAIEALKAYKAKCNHEGDIYSAMVVQRCINLLQRLNKKQPAMGEISCGSPRWIGS